MSDTWWAAVRYTDGEGENVPVNRIKNFVPNNPKDYQSGKKYTVRTTKWNKDGKEERYKAYIVRLAESLPALEQSLLKKRATCPPLEVRDSDGPITSTNDENEIADPVEVQRSLQKDKRRKRQHASDNIMASFIEQARVNSSYLKLTASTSASLEDHVQPSVSNDESLQSKDLLIQQLTKKVKILENELSNRSKDAVLAKLDVMEERIEGINKIEAKMLKIEKLLSHRPPRAQTALALSTTVSSTSGRASISCISDGAQIVVEVENDKVDLGEGWKCTLTAFQNMERAKEKYDWANAILVGVFGEEAKLYRVQHRTPGLKNFDKGFLRVAKEHYGRFLKKINYKEPGLSDTLQQMPAMLADRATDLGGRRGRGRPIRRYDQADSGEDDDDQDILDPTTGDLRARMRTVLNESTGEFQNLPIK